MQKRSRSKKIIVLLLIAAAIAAAIMGYRYVHKGPDHSEADSVLETMQVLIPGLGVDTDAHTGDGKDPLPVMTINGVDIVGCLEIPSINIMAPVKSKGESIDGFVTYVSGSAVKGRLFLYSRKNDLFGKLSALKPGTKATFTDVDGIRYNYIVLTQFHLKKWDASKADYDLMLYYKTDEDTRFVVGLNRE